MRSKGLVVLVVAGLLVVGYAFFTVLDAGPSRPGVAARSRGEGSVRAGADAEREHEVESDDDEPRARRRPTRRAEPRADSPPAVVTDAADARPTPGPPPRPEPEISLPDARARFSEMMAELDRVKDRGTTLTSPEWVEYYKRGHEALLPLQQHLDWAVPEQADELRRANEQMRAKLRAIDPAAPPEMLP